jgi:hypothetical protein
LAETAQRLQELEVLHVAGTDLEHVGVRGHRVQILHPEDLRHDRQPHRAPRFSEEVESVHPEPLEAVR